MVLSVEQERVKMLIRDTIALMCKNGLAFNNEFSIDAVIGVTLDNQSLFYMSFNEVIKADKESEDLIEESTTSESEIKLLPRKRHKGDPAASDRDDTEENSHLSEVSKLSQRDADRDSSLKLESVSAENEKHVSVKQEIGADWDSLATEIAGGNVTSAGTSDGVDNSFISHSLYLGGFDACSLQSNTWPLGNVSKSAGNITEPGDNSQDGSRVCFICNKRLMSRGSYRLHMNAHRGIFPHYCSYCNKGFTSKRNLRGHLYIHTGIKDYKCEICQQEFSYEVNMKAHKRSVHGVPDRIHISTSDNLNHNVTVYTSDN